ncbi:hypothetical protein ON010_g9076 [Phytophthora cinnamomi]|nr:hypothetical protein ON010_g9076 [Phytophthora cinnamomi]
MGKTKGSRRGSKKGARGDQQTAPLPKVTSANRCVNAALVQTKITPPQQRQKWIPKYEAELGLQPLSTSVVDGEITEAWCKFCQAFGGEIAPA